jgi:hypothetical protein
VDLVRFLLFHFFFRICFFHYLSFYFLLFVLFLPYISTFVSFCSQINNNLLFKEIRSLVYFCSRTYSVLFLHSEIFVSLISEFFSINYFVPSKVTFVPGRIAFCFFIQRDLFLLFQKISSTNYFVP